MPTQKQLAAGLRPGKFANGVPAKPYALASGSHDRRRLVPWPPGAEPSAWRPSCGTSDAQYRAFPKCAERRCINCDVMDLIRIAGTGIDVARHRMVRAEAAAIHGNPCCSIFLEKQVYCVNVPLSFFIN